MHMTYDDLVAWEQQRERQRRGLAVPPGEDGRRCSCGQYLDANGQCPSLGDTPYDDGWDDDEEESDDDGSL